MAELLTETERAGALAALDGWSDVAGRDALSKGFLFKDFNAALGFMVRVGQKAEAMGHHPEWKNVYNRVDVILTTHDAGGVTELDIELAAFMDEIEKD